MIRDYLCPTIPVSAARALVAGVLHARQARFQPISPCSSRASPFPGSSSTTVPANSSGVQRGRFPPDGALLLGYGAPFYPGGLFALMVV